jgi:hypothetical protein
MAVNTDPRAIVRSRAICTASRSPHPKCRTSHPCCGSSWPPRSPQGFSLAAFCHQRSRTGLRRLESCPVSRAAADYTARACARYEARTTP